MIAVCDDHRASTSALRCIDQCALFSRRILQFLDRGRARGNSTYHSISSNNVTESNVDESVFQRMPPVSAQYKAQKPALFLSPVRYSCPLPWYSLRYILPLRENYSTFWTCSLSFSISSFILTTRKAISASLALAPMVLASRFIS